MRCLALIGAGALLAACGGGGSDDSGGGGDPDVWHLRAINVIADAPQVQFNVDDVPVSTAAFGGATDYKPAHTGERTLKLAIRNPSDLETSSPGFTEIGEETSFDFQGPTDYTVVAAGTVEDPHQYRITGTLREDVGDNQVEYQVINALPGSGELTVLIKAPRADIGDFDPVGSFAPGQYSDLALLDINKASGASEDAQRAVGISLQVRDGADTIFESDALSVVEGTRVLIVVTGNQGPAGNAPVRLMLFGGIRESAGLVRLDQDDRSELRFANFSSDAEPMSLVTTHNGDQATLQSDLAFGEQSAYFTLDVDTFDSVVSPTSNSGVFYFVNNFTTEPGRSFTLYAQGRLGNMRGLFVTDDRRVISTEARFRFFHGAPADTKSMTVYMTPHGEELDLEGTDADSPIVASLAYRVLSELTSLEEGSYDVYFTHAGSKDVVLGPVELTLADGSVQTLALIENPARELTLSAVDDARD